MSPQPVAKGAKQGFIKMRLQKAQHAGNVRQVEGLVIPQGEPAEDPGDLAVALGSEHPVPEFEVIHIKKGHRFKIPLLHLFGVV